MEKETIQNNGHRYYYTLEGPWEDQTFVYDSETHRVVGNYISSTGNEALKCIDVTDDPDYQTQAKLNGKPIEIDSVVFDALYKEYLTWRSTHYQNMDSNQRDKFNRRLSELMTRFSIPLWLRHAKDDGKMPKAVSQLEQKLHDLIKEERVGLNGLED